MTNEIDLNTFSSFEKRLMWIEVGDAPMAVPYSISRRSGFTAVMVADAIKHLMFGIWALANFEAWQNTEKWDDWRQTETDAPELPVATHGEARVLIFCDIPVKVGNNIIPFQLNIFTEYTSAWELFYNVHEQLVSNDDIAALENKMQPKGDKKPQRLNPPATQPVAPQQQPGKSGETPYFEQAPNRQYLGENHSQSVVAIQVLKIDVGYKDGQRTYDMHASYRGDASQYPFDTTRIYGKRRTGETFTAVKDNATVVYLEGLAMGAHSVETRAVFWVQKGKQEKTNKDGESYFPTYLNLSKLDIAHEQAPKAGEESQLPPGGFQDDVGAHEMAEHEMRESDDRIGENQARKAEENKQRGDDNIPDVQRSSHQYKQPGDIP